jgi:hypothetical protein
MLGNDLDPLRLGEALALRRRRLLCAYAALLGKPAKEQPVCAK